MKRFLTLAAITGCILSLAAQSRAQVKQMVTFAVVQSQRVPLTLEAARRVTVSLGVETLVRSTPAPVHFLLPMERGIPSLSGIKSVIRNAGVRRAFVTVTD
jgi:hypothetical protein